MNAQGQSRWPSTESFRHRNGGGGLEIVYGLGLQNQAAFTTFSSTVNLLRGEYDVVGKTGPIDRIYIEVTTLGASAVGRAGMYNVASLLNLNPTTLLVDSGEFDCSTTGVKAGTVSVVRPAGTVVGVTLIGTATVVLRASGVASRSMYSGVGSALVSPMVLANSTQAYGALPASYTTPTWTATATNRPLVAVRYS